MFSTNLMTSNSSFVDVPWAFIGTWVSLPHRVMIFSLNNPIPPNEGTIAGFPKISQVPYVMILTRVSASNTQSMSKSLILVSVHSFSFNIYDKFMSLWSFSVSFSCNNIASDSFWLFGIFLVSWSSSWFSCVMFIFSTFAIILGKSKTTCPIALQQRKIWPLLGIP